MAYERLNAVLKNSGENYLLPFFWQHWEDDSTLIREINAIYDSGIRALCVESRTHEDFCGDGWWHTMDIILAECEKRGMKVWLLDDKHFPSGYANGIIPKKYPERKIWAMTERHMDVYGPIADSCVISDWATAPEDELLGIFACKRVEGKLTLTGEIREVTNRERDGLLWLDLPEGCWRIVWLFKSRSGFAGYTLDYADKLTDAGGEAFIEAVYQPHYEHYARYFGNTFAGFFSDEPCFENNLINGFRAELGRKYTHFPYAPEVFELLGEEKRNMLPAIWFDTADSTAQKIRLAYMDVITRLYNRYFSGKLGNWCRAHGVEYIGHIIEDDDQHVGTASSSGHFFRALDGQDMSGIDVVLCQVVPGMTDDIFTVPCSYNVVNPELFHFMLPKLGASHAHIQTSKKGRAMCEIFGAYGWAEGMPMCKWLADLMMVRGINYFVPHAFTPKFPDPDCPPHMYAAGTNPEFGQFKTLFGYMNRICHLTSGGVHRASAAVVYYAEAKWAGGSFMKTDTVIRTLTEALIDSDVVPWDYLADAEVRDGRLVLSHESYPTLIVPGSQYLPNSAFDIMNRLSKEGLPIYIVGEVPKCAETHEEMWFGENIYLISLEKLEEKLRESGFADVTALKMDHVTRFLRFYHYVHDDFEFYFMTNENVFQSVRTELKLAAFSGGSYIVYNAMENRAYRAESGNGTINVDIPPYGSVFFIFGADTSAFTALPAATSKSIRELSCVWNISVAPHNDTIFKPYCQTDTLLNITGADELPHFSGHIRYETAFTVSMAESAAPLMLDLGQVGECAKIWINGRLIGERICYPYRFDISGAVTEGENTFTVEVTNHYGYEMRDKFSKYLVMGPSGLLGKIKLLIG